MDIEWLKQDFMWSAVGIGVGLFIAGAVMLWMWIKSRKY